MPNAVDLQAVGSLLVAVGLGGVLVAIINTFLSPKARAETRAIAQGAAREEVAQSIATLRADVADARARAAAAEDRADRAEEHADASDAKYDSCMAQNRTLVEALWRYSAWSKMYYDAGHPPGMEPPPVLDNLYLFQPPTHKGNP